MQWHAKYLHPWEIHIWPRQGNNLCSRGEQQGNLFVRWPKKSSNIFPNKCIQKLGGANMINMPNNFSQY